MIYALGAAILFSASAVTGKRLSGFIANGALANLLRLSFAAVLLGMWAIPSGGGIFREGWWTLWWSGVIGFGIGDVALFFSLRAIGARLTIMMIHCLATPAGALMEWMFLGITVSTIEIAVTSAILLGVLVSIGGQRNAGSSGKPLSTIGFVWGFLASLGQAGGAVMSRGAYQMMDAANISADPASVAWIRILGGIFFSAVFYLVHRWRFRPIPVLPGSKSHGDHRNLIIGLIILNGFLGPVAGVSLYQWALMSAPTAIVLPVVALSPVMLIPLSRKVDGIEPSAVSIAGGFVAITSVVVLGVLRG